MMKRYPFLSVFVLCATVFLFAGCTENESSKNKNATANKSKYFSVAIMQDGKFIPVINHSVKIRRAPFKIVLNLAEGNDGVLVNASFSPDSYKAAKSGKPFGQILGFTDTGLADHTFNKNESVIINDMAPNYWYYNNAEDHRFNNVIKRWNFILCERNISQFYYNNIFVPVNKFTGTSLYLVFAKGDYDKEYKFIEKQREFLRIRFR